MRVRRPYKKIAGGILIDREVLARLNVLHWAARIHEGYVWVFTGPSARDRYELLSRFTVEFIDGPIPSGREVHHKNGNTLDNRYENLRALSPKGHRGLHRVLLENRGARRADPRNDLWRPQNPRAVRTVSQLSLFPETLSSKIEVFKKALPSAFEYELVLERALRANRGLVEAIAKPLDSGARIPPRGPEKWLRSDVPEGDVDAVRLGCDAAEATLVRLLALFRTDTARFCLRLVLAFLNAHLDPKDQAALEAMRASRDAVHAPHIDPHAQERAKKRERDGIEAPRGVRERCPCCGDYEVCGDTRITMAVLRRVLTRVPVQQAVRDFVHYGRLPKVNARWYPRPDSN